MILASNSPRRKSIMTEMGYSFLQEAHPTDERFPDNIPIHDVAKYLATKKNKYHRDIFRNDVIITSDTTVLLENRLLEKPDDMLEAKQMLYTLSGQTHLVITGVCISDRSQSISFDDDTEVTFNRLSDEEIDYYVSKFKPLDKAGAYGIQEWIGMAGIHTIKGSYFNVMGLPIHKVYQVLKDDFGITPY
jgi:septum formation protein